MHKKIRHARTLTGSSQEAVGNICIPPISKAAVGQWESDDPEKRTAPTTDNLYALSKLTGHPMEYFLNDELDVVSPAYPQSYIDAKQDQTRTQLKKAQEGAATLLNGPLANYFKRASTQDKINMVIHLYELLHDDELCDSMLRLSQQALLKLLQLPTQ